MAVPLRNGAAPALASAICAHKSSKIIILQFLGFSLKATNLGGVSSGVGSYPTQLHPENSQVMNPNFLGPVQPLHLAPSTPLLALGVGAPGTPPLATPPISLVRATPMTPPVVSPRSPALSYERMQVFIQQSQDRTSVFQARALSEQSLFAKKRELEEHYHLHWREGPWRVSPQKPTSMLNMNSTTSRQNSASATTSSGKCCVQRPVRRGKCLGPRAFPKQCALNKKLSASLRAESSQRELATARSILPLKLSQNSCELRTPYCKKRQRRCLLRQELRNYMVTHFVQEFQMSTIRNALDYQQKRSRNKEQQFQAAKRQFHEQKVARQKLQKEIRRLTRSEASTQQQRQQHAMQLHTLTQEEIRNVSLSLLSLSFLPKTSNTRNDTLATRLQLHEDEEQKHAEEYKVPRTEWAEWSADQMAEMAAAAHCPAPLPARSSVVEHQPPQFQPWTPPPWLAKSPPKKPERTALQSVPQPPPPVSSRDGAHHFCQPPTARRSSLTWLVPAAESFVIPTPAGTQEQGGVGPQG